MENLRNDAMLGCPYSKTHIGLDQKNGFIDVIINKLQGKNYIFCFCSKSDIYKAEKNGTHRVKVRYIRPFLEMTQILENKVLRAEANV